MYNDQHVEANYCAVNTSFILFHDKQNNNEKQIMSSWHVLQAKTKRVTRTDYMI